MKSRRNSPCEATPPGGTVQTFAKATSPYGFEALRELLKVKTLRELLVHIEATFRNQHFTRMVQSSRYWHLDWETLLNLKDIRRAAELQN